MNTYIASAISATIAFIIVLIIGITSTLVSPVIGAALYSLPVSMTALLMMFYFSNQPDDVSKKLLTSTAFTMIALETFIVVWAVGMTNLFPDNRKKRFWATFGIAFGAWFAINSILLTVVSTVPSVRNKLF
jgi:hypothetical protein